MSDVHDPTVRSYNMSRIKGKNTKPEIVVRRYLHSHGFRFRLHVKDLPGKPDVVLKKFKTVIFIHGCFWHGHEGCKYFKLLKTRTQWWEEKISKTRKLDKKNDSLLRKLGWRIIEIWECELKPVRIEITLSKLTETIRNSKND